MRRERTAPRWAAGLAFAAILFSACGGTSPPTDQAADPPGLPGRGPILSAGDRIPLTELGRRTYLAFQGGLYPEGANEPPADHIAAGRSALREIVPLDRDGRRAPDGKIAFVSVGMSNTTQEFCSKDGAPPCTRWSFMGQAAADPVVDRDALVVVNGALGGQAAETWDAPTDHNFDRVRDRVLAPLGLTERQVQVAWIKQANPRPTLSLPHPNADALELERSLGAIVRAMKARWPSLRIVFLSSRIYGGYAENALNPEPYAYESGFSVKWLIAAQIEQARTGRVDRESGDLAIARTPWLVWGPYLWAAGTDPRTDGLVWLRTDFEEDGTHPSRKGEEKVGRLLLDFFKTYPASRCWFLAGRRCS